jgi:PAS domain-containing protein
LCRLRSILSAATEEISDAVLTAIDTIYLENWSHPTDGGSALVTPQTVRTSVAGVTHVLVDSIERRGWCGPDDDRLWESEDPAVAVGLVGNSLRMSAVWTPQTYEWLLGTYCNAILGAVHATRDGGPSARAYTDAILRFFDRAAGAVRQDRAPSPVRLACATPSSPCVARSPRASRPRSEPQPSGSDSIAVVLMDARGEIEHTNRKAEQLFGIGPTPSSALSRSRVGRQHLDALAPEIDAFLRGDGWQFLLIGPLPTTGGVRDLRVHLKRRYTPDGEPAGMMIAVAELPALGLAA